ncbi:MAG: hypothetical protein M3N68_09360 [Actinomycetota bacterium]|nr:hypothetical protein [Actinomycetota bacterium]
MRSTGKRELRLLAALTAALVTILATGCSRDGEPERRGVPPTLPERAAGVEITVRGRVVRVLDAHVFEIGGETGEPVLVVAANGMAGVAPVADVEATGTVETFEIGSMERRIGARLKPELQQFNGRTCVVATRIMPAAGAG